MAILYRDPVAPPPGDYDVHRLSTPAAALIETSNALWHDAQQIEWGPQRYRTRFQALWDAQALHVRWDSVDDSPWHTMTTRDEHIWNEEVIEIFLDATGSGVNYAELEINPVNVVCDLRVETPYPTVKSLTDWDWTGMTSAVVPLKDAHGATEGWTALGRLPWAGLATMTPETAAKTPPRPGDAWHFNVFRIKRPGGPSKPEEGAVFAAWSVPDGPSFHVPSAFRPFKFL